MTFTEKLTGAYLRLNGFLLLPQFTTFGADSPKHKRHTHIDWIGMRRAGSAEVVEGKELPLDALLFRTISQLLGISERRCLSLDIPIVAEVKTQRTIEKPSEENIDYARSFLGDHHVVPIAFCLRAKETIFLKHGIIVVTHQHAIAWIWARFRWMMDNLCAPTKEGSWAHSDEFIADLLVMFGSDLMRPSNAGDKQEFLFPRKPNTRG